MTRPAASRHPGTTRTWLVLASLAFLLLAFPLFVRPALAEDTTVVLEDVAFRPASIEIESGDTVTWTHRDGDTPHTVTSSSTPPGASSWDSHPTCTPPGTPITCMTEGDPDFVRTFEVAGTYEYFCKVHPEQMRGTIVVTETDTSSTTSSSTTTSTTSTTTPTSTTSTKTDGSATTTTAAPEPEGTTAVETTSPDDVATGEEATGAGDGDGSAGVALLATLLVLTVAGGSALLWRLRPRPAVEAILVELPDEDSPDEESPDEESPDEESPDDG